jgi:hypothetical protein
MGTPGDRDPFQVEGDVVPGLDNLQFKTNASPSSSFNDQKRSVSGFEALLPEPAEGLKYSVTFDEAPTLSEDVIGFLKNQKNRHVVNIFSLNVNVLICSVLIVLPLRILLRWRDDMASSLWHVPGRFARC